jgi:hypothetical protein
MTHLFRIIFIASFMALLSSEVIAQSAATSETLAASSFVKKRYNIKGTWALTEEDGQSLISFNDDFRTKGGPDLKLYLSSKSISELKSGDVEGTSMKLSVLKSNKGAQSYIIPNDVNLSDYKSVVIHCEAFEVLWGGFDIAKTP